MSEVLSILTENAKIIIYCRYVTNTTKYSNILTPQQGVYVMTVGDAKPVIAIMSLIFRPMATSSSSAWATG